MARRVYDSPLSISTLLLGAVLLMAAPAVGRADPPAPSNNSDYANRVVAFLEGGEVITRQDLGEYLLARMGAKKIDDMLKRTLIDLAAKEAGVSVTDAEVETAFTEALQGLPREKFIQEVIRGHYGLTLFEWKEDRLRPKLLLTKICREKLSYNEEDIRQAFEMNHGEKIQVRMILWPKEKLKEAQADYARLRDDDEFFNETARKQGRSDLASSGGKIRPIARYTLGDDVVEKAAFSLKPGQVSELLDTRDGIMLLKCDQRIPPDTTVNLEAKRAELIKDVLDRKLRAEIPQKMQELETRGRPRKLKIDWTVRAEPNQPIAHLGEGVPVTREQFGEYLIARFGSSKLDMLVNSRIIAAVCKGKEITVSDAEIEAALAAHVKKYNATAEVFEKKVLEPAGSSLYEFKEDMLRPELLMSKLVRPQVKATEAEVKLAYDAYHGERVECRMILYPRGEERVAMQEYAQLRDSEEAFARKAKNQASSRLAALGGKLPPIGRNTTGNEELEREMFSLNPGEVSRLVGSPEGTVLVKCDRRIPADSSVSLETVRETLTQEVLQRKLRVEIPRYFADLRKNANPRIMLKDPNRVEDFTSVGKELEQAGYVAPPSTVMPKP